MLQNKHKEVAIKIKDSLLRNELDELGSLINDSWQSKKRLSPKITNAEIDRIYQVGISNGAFGGRLLGSGGGGYLLFFHPPSKRNQLTRALKDAGTEILSFNFDFSGTKVWPVKNR